MCIAHSLGHHTLQHTHTISIQAVLFWEDLPAQQGPITTKKQATKPNTNVHKYTLTHIYTETTVYLYTIIYIYIYIITL